MSVGVGVDVGAASVTVAAVRRTGGSLALLYFQQHTLPELGLKPNPAPAQVAQAVAREMREGGYSTKSIVLGVSGRDAIIRYSHLPPMPDWRLGLLMQMEIDDVAERTGEPLSADFRVLPTDGEGNLVLVALAKDARVKESVAAFEAAGLEVAGAVPQPVATGDCFRYLADEPERDITLVLDVGQGSTEVSIVEEGELIFARSVALGGEAFTDRIQKRLSITRDTAEEVKLSGRTPDGEDAEHLLRGPRDQLAQMVKASVDFAKKQLQRRNLRIERVVVSGGGARVPGLAEALGEELGATGEVFDPLAGLDQAPASKASREAADEFGLESATAVGLALSVILPGATRMDLLPISVKEKLEFRHRTIWLYVSAAVMAAALLLSFALAIWEHMGESGRKDGLIAAKTEAGNRLSAHEERAEENDNREADLRALSDRARPGFHLASLLRTLGEVTPTEVSFVDGSLVQDDTLGSFHFEFEGVADNAQGNGVAAMRDLELALTNHARIAEARVQPLGLEEGTSRRFRLTIVPTGNPVAEEGDS